MTRKNKNDVYQNEMNPELYLQREREAKAKDREEILGCIFAAVFAFILFAVWMIAEGVWTF